MSRHVHVLGDGTVVVERAPAPQRQLRRRRFVGDSLPFDYAETREPRETSEAVCDAAPTMAQRIRALAERHRRFWENLNGR